MDLFKAIFADSSSDSDSSHSDTETNTNKNETATALRKEASTTHLPMKRQWQDLSIVTSTVLHRPVHEQPQNQNSHPTLSGTDGRDDGGCGRDLAGDRRDGDRVHGNRKREQYRYRDGGHGDVRIHGDGIHGDGSRGDGSSRDGDGWHDNRSRKHHRSNGDGRHDNRSRDHHGHNNEGDSGRTNETKSTSQKRDSRTFYEEGKGQSKEDEEMAARLPPVKEAEAVVQQAKFGPTIPLGIIVVQ